MTKMLASAGLVLGIIAAALAAPTGAWAADPASAPDAAQSIAPGPFKPNWDSLKQYQVPEWFRDAKFGIWAHWSAQCVPEQGDWYARGMYQEGSGQYKYHVEHYGHPSKFGFKDICHLWKAEHWDPDKLIALYKRAGAKYFVALGNHHCNFDCWDSKYQPWNSVNIGPKKDIVGLWAQAARKQGLRFGVTIHSARSWDWYDVAHGSDKTGALKGVPYDGALTKADGKGKWWEGYDPADLYGPHGAARTPEAREAYVRKFFLRVKDLIDHYQPDLLYFDDGDLPLGEAGLKIAAHYYNANLRWHQGKEEAILNIKGMPPGCRGAVVLDIERGLSDRLEQYPWQTDTCIGEWHYHRGIRYKTARQVIPMLADIVSKNGNLLLNIPVRGDGTIDDEEVRFLEEMAKWMAVNSDAVFGTRPWLVYGEGAKGGKGGAFNEGRTKPGTASDIRFTTKGDLLYAIALGWPTDGKLVVCSLAKLPEVTGKVAGVTLLGHKGELKWTHDEKGLTVTMPAEKPCDYAYVLKITGEDLLKGFQPDKVPQAGVEPIRPGADGSVTLGADRADLHGSKIQVEYRTDAGNIGYWDDSTDWASWKVQGMAPGAYEVTARCAAAVGPSELVVDVAGQQLTGKAPKTDSWDDYQTVDFGKVQVKQAGDCVVKVRPRDAKTWRAVNLMSIRLRKTG